MSVIIPAYNRAHLIERTLQSVVNQSYPHWEVIVVDDGSTDTTAKVVESFARTHGCTAAIRLIQQSNQGVSVARNTGLAHATGDYVCFLDSDDTYQPQFLEATVRTAQTHAVPIVFTAFQQTKPHWSRAKLLQYGDSRLLTLGEFDFFDFGWCIHINACLFDRSVFNTPPVQFTPHLTHGEDTEVLIKLLHAYASYYVAQPLFTYHVQPCSVTLQATPHTQRLHMYSRTLQYLQQTLPDTPASHKQLRSLSIVLFLEALAALKKMPRRECASQRNHIYATYVAPMPLRVLWNEPRLSLWKKTKASFRKFVPC